MYFYLDKNMNGNITLVYCGLMNELNIIIKDCMKERHGKSSIFSICRHFKQILPKKHHKWAVFNIKAVTDIFTIRAKWYSMYRKCIVSKTIKCETGSRI